MCCRLTRCDGPVPDALVNSRDCWCLEFEASPRGLYKGRVGGEPPHAARAIAFSPVAFQAPPVLLYCLVLVP